MEILRSKNINLPYYLLFKTEEILKGEHDAIWGVFYYLMRYTQNNLMVEAQNSNAKILNNSI